MIGSRTLSLLGVLWLLAAPGLAPAEDGASDCLPPESIDRPTGEERRRALFRSADACSRSGDVERALELYGKIRAEDPSGTEAPFWEGTLHRRRGELDEARESFDETLRRNPNHVDALVGRARVHLRLGDLDAAETDLARAAELSPDNSEIREVRGSLLRRRGETEAAAREFEAALAASPRNVDARLGLARIENSRGRPEQGLSLARGVLEQTPTYDEAVTVAARSLEALGRDREAYDEFLEALRRRPEDEETWRGLWRTAPTARPNLGFRFRTYDSKVVESRGSLLNPPILTRYSGWRFIEEGRLPISDQLAWIVEAEQFRDELEQRSLDFTIYDVFGFRGLTGVELRPWREWQFTLAAGGASFDSETEDPIDDDAMALARANATWRSAEYALDVEVGYGRDYLFGRSLAGDVDFEIYSEDRVYVRLDKALGGPWSWRGSASYLHYGEGSEPTILSTALAYDGSPLTVVAYGDYSPLQTYFLKDDGRLEFVEVLSLGLRGSLEIFEWLETRGGVRGSSYSDSNDERFAWGETIVYPLPIPFVRFGMRYEIRDFHKNSSKYSSYDYDQWGPLVGVGGTIVPRLDFDVEYAHGFRDETFGEPFDEDSVRWTFEYFLNPMLRIGTDGVYARDDLPQRRRRIGAFARAVF